jgi:hypothetical protein
VRGLVQIGNAIGKNVNQMYLRSSPRKVSTKVLDGVRRAGRVGYSIFSRSPPLRTSRPAFHRLFDLLEEIPAFSHISPLKLVEGAEEGGWDTYSEEHTEHV